MRIRASTGSALHLLAGPPNTPQNPLEVQPSICCSGCRTSPPDHRAAIGPVQLPCEHVFCRITGRNDWPLDRQGRGVRAKTELSVLIPALHKGPNLAVLLPWLNRILEELGMSHEVIVITKDDDSETISAAAVAGTQVLTQVSNGYGGALIDGLNGHSETSF